MSISDERIIELADELAWHLFNTESDAGELKKSLEYYRTTRDRARFIQLLRVRSNNPRLFQRSKQTRIYYQEMSQKISEMLNRPELTEESNALRVLGWAFRLMQFYKAERLSHSVSQLPVMQERASREGERHIGVVKWFDLVKQYGFITPDGGGDDVFVHISQTPEQQGLQEGQRVSFVTEMEPKGPRARDVQPE